ncbi:MAG: hypothetical protein ACW98Y_20945, partial [Candidatus Thorarchaeota archaeon]
MSTKKRCKTGKNRQATFLVLILLFCFLFDQSAFTLLTTSIAEPDNNRANAIASGFPQETLDETNVLLIEDGFITSPNGFNDNLWELNQNGSATNWDGSNWLSFEANSESFTSINSKMALSPEILVIGPESPSVQYANGLIAEFEMSFTGGQTYFGVGWLDYDTCQNDSWDGNLRDGATGVFLDYWDGHLYLISRFENQT